MALNPFCDKTLQMLSLAQDYHHYLSVHFACTLCFLFFCNCTSTCPCHTTTFFENEWKVFFFSTSVHIISIMMFLVCTVSVFWKGGGGGSTLYRLRARRALTLFHQKPEGCYCHRLCTAIAPFWFSTGHSV